MSSAQSLLDRELGGATEKLSLMSHEAAHAVFSTNELLCDIVARLPFKDILSATRTCKAWRDALKADHHVQEALFLKPMEVREVRCDNHLLNDVERAISLDDCTVFGKIHPLIKAVFGHVVVGNELRFCPDVYPKLEYPNNTWREMFITQPPCKKVIASIIPKPFYPSSNQIFGRGTGVTLGELYDFIHSHITSNAEEPLGHIRLCGYADEDSLFNNKLFASRCQVRAGEVCRPTELPLEVYSDPDSSDDSDSDSDHDLSDVDEHWDSVLIRSGYYHGDDHADYADEDLHKYPVARADRAEFFRNKTRDSD